MRLLLSKALAVLLLAIPTSARCASEILVDAAASLSEALKDIGSDYQMQSADKVAFNLGASSMLARQLSEGASADIFFSADEAKMDELEKKGLIVAETRTNRLSNTLVIVVPREGGVAIS